MKLRFARSADKAAVEVRPLLQGDFIPDTAREDGFSGLVGQASEIWLDRRVLVVGVGSAWSDRSAERAGAVAASRTLDVARIAIDARKLPADIAASLAFGAVLRGWRMERYRSKPAEDTPRLNAIDVLTDEPRAARAAWDRLRPVLRGILWARRAVTDPANVLTPEKFCGRLKKLERHGLELEVLERRHLKRAGLGALLAVGGGSINPPRLAILRWRGRIDAPPVVFCGKGITFDTGGISIKPADKMWEMRADMAGAAAAVGAMIALARRKSPAPAIAVLALAENALSATAYRPGDILHTVDGTTIEVIDTDAEGRLVLADALGWSRLNLAPRAMIDLATLTGSIVTALGHEMAGLFDNNAAFAASVAAAGEAVGERVWRMPIAAGYREDLRSDIADLKQCATGRLQPDACQAAALLENFAGSTIWAHLDIAAMESRERADEFHAAGATGFGVRLLDRLIAQRFEDADG